MLKQWTAAITFALCTIGPAVAQKHTPAVTTPAIAMRSADHMTGNVTGVLSGNPEFGMLLCLGAVFVGSAALFSARRSEL